MKKEYNLRILKDNKYTFERFTDKRKCVRKAKQLFFTEKDIKEIAIFQNVIGDDFGIVYPKECATILYYFRL